MLLSHTHPVKWVAACGAAAAMCLAAWAIVAGTGGAIGADGLRATPQMVASMGWSAHAARLAATVLGFVALGAMIWILADDRAPRNS